MEQASGDVAGVSKGGGRRPRRRPGWPGWLLAFAAFGGFAACYDAATRSENPRGPDDGDLDAQIGLEGHGSTVWGLAFSPDGARLAAATMDGTVSLKDLASGRPASAARGAPGLARLLAFTSDGRVLAAAGLGPAVRLWDAATFAEHPPLTVGGTRVNGLAFSPDGARLTVVARDRPAADWDWRRGRSCDTPARPVGEATRLAASADGAALAVCDSVGRITLWGPGAGRKVVVNARRAPAAALALSPDGKTLAVAAPPDPAVVRVYDEAGEPRYSVGGEGRGVTGLAFSPDGALLAAADEDGRARLYDAAEGRKRGVVAAPRALYAVAFSPDGATLATGDQGGDVRLWSVARALAADRRERPRARHAPAAALGRLCGRLAAEIRKIPLTLAVLRLLS